jgi:hypothetical protein
MGLDAVTRGLLGKRTLMELSSADARRSIRGTKALWTELIFQKPSNAAAFESLALDLKTTDLEGQLRSAGFRLMDPKKRSLALGLRPTLLLSVLFTPKGAEGNNFDFYLVMAKATQDVTPLGGTTMSMTTWMKVGDAIASTGDIPKDIEAIRASARACVMDFIDVAQDNDQAPQAAPAPGTRP